jgi:peptidoglycan/xylan/chitin deacetylase (PgdA/CDA1 family)
MTFANKVVRTTAGADLDGLHDPGRLHIGRGIMSETNDDRQAIEISVVIPALNEEKLLPFCLDSLKRQTFSGAFEVIVVDNNSDDRTAAVAHDMGARIVVEPHRGITWARQKGLQAARGEIIACVDADSKVEPDWLERIWSSLDQDQGSVAVSGMVRFEKGRSWRGDLHRWSTSLTLFGDRALRLIFAKQGTLWGANFAVRRSALLKAGGFNREIRFYGEDTELSLRLRRQGRIAFDKNNQVDSSPRRFEKGGVLKTTWLIASAFIRLVVTDGRSAGREPPPKWYHRAVPASVFVLFVFLSILSGGVYLAFSPSSMIYGMVYNGAKGCRDKVIALTFDDGPNEPTTSQVLKILDDHGVKATFFVIGENAATYPDSIKKIVRDGHIIGNHTYTHSYRLPFQGFRQVRASIIRTEDTIFHLTGLRTELFRPPHGLRTPWFIRDIKRLNYTVVTWSDMTNDYAANATTGEIVSRIVHKARPGSIIDLHDGKDEFHGIDRGNMVRALPTIIERLKDEGYRFVTLPELLHTAPYK